MDKLVCVYEMLRKGNKSVTMKYEDYPKYVKMYDSLTDDEKNSIMQKVADRKSKRPMKGSRPLSAR